MSGGAFVGRDGDHPGASRFVIGLDEAACLRLEQVERLSLAFAGSDACSVKVALPKSYAGKQRRRYPLLLLLDGDDYFGSAIEMSRAMADTGEVEECILVSIGRGAPADAPACAAFLQDELLPWCEAGYRVRPQAIALFDPRAEGAVAVELMALPWSPIRRLMFATADRAGLDRVLDALPAAVENLRLAVSLRTASGAATCAPVGSAAGVELSLRYLDGMSPAAARMPSLINGLRAFWSTGKAYGAGVDFFSHGLVAGLCRLALPLTRRLVTKPRFEAGIGNPYLMRSVAMDRDFEIFVSLPASFAAADPSRRYPALLCLDANMEFSTVAEIAARMAASGEIGELIVVGVGFPRAAGHDDFAFGRLEAFSPPTDGYDHRDPLGHILSSLMALKGRDARRRLGRADRFHRFLCDELLPILQRQLPVDSADLALLGHSAGGTLVAYALQQPASPFRRFLALSPGLAISGNWLLRSAGEPAGTSGVRRSVFFSIGCEELHNVFNQRAGIPDTEGYARRLSADPGIDLRFLQLGDESHSSVFTRAVAQAMSFVYGAAPAPGSVT